MNHSKINALSLIVGIAFLQSVVAQEGWDTEPSLVNITDNVFRTVHRPAAANSVVIATDEGLVVVDGTCRGRGDPAWLKEELARRFDVPVKYVILSHDHEDHICDLQVFDDTAVTISHARTREHILRENRNTSIPDIVFHQDQMEFFLGGKQFILYYFGHTHSDNLIQIHIPDEGVLIAPDLSRSGKSLVLPDFRDADVNNMIDTLEKLSKLNDVDIVIPGHRGTTTQDRFMDYQKYVIALRDRVLEQMVNGATVEEILETVTMEDFSDYGNIDLWLRSNIISMWDNMYRYREPNVNSDAAGDYQSSYPIGYPIGGYQSGNQ
ncbi:MAG: MBL fold metallo-hydrolase [Proteobacteria bacterium]|jgi:glyoxylase-like metal-dependent hydrolase (beta-lactamase superfamily II)|nr:MBL fold metallo-hydrolase [Pseudomonadota bacterium]